MVVFEPSIWDRLDACAHALLALVMCDRAGFAVMVNGILDQLKPEVGGQAGGPATDPAARSEVLPRTTILEFCVLVPVVWMVGGALSWTGAGAVAA